MLLNIFKRRKGLTIPVQPTIASVVLDFNSDGDPWSDKSGHVFTRVGNQAYVADGKMLNAADKDTYITTSDSPDLRLTGDFTLKFGIRDWVDSMIYASLYQKGIPASGTAQVGQFFIYGSNELFITSDQGNQYYDVTNGGSAQLTKTVSDIDITITRKGDVLTVYSGKIVSGTYNVAGKTFGNNALPLNLNGGNLVYTFGNTAKLDYWELINGKAIDP